MVARPCKIARLVVSHHEDEKRIQIQNRSLTHLLLFHSMAGRNLHVSCYVFSVDMPKLWRISHNFILPKWSIFASSWYCSISFLKVKLTHKNHVTMSFSCHYKIIICTSDLGHHQLITFMRPYIWIVFLLSNHPLFVHHLVHLTITIVCL